MPFLFNKICKEERLWIYLKKLYLRKKYIMGIFTVEKLSVLLPDGNTSTRDIVRHCGAVAIIAVTQDEKNTIC